MERIKVNPYAFPSRFDDVKFDASDPAAKSMTIQSAADECDVNQIVERALKTSVLGDPVAMARRVASSPSGAMAVMQNPSKDLPSNIGQVYSNAKAMADVRLTNESINTQKSLQLANKAAAAQSAANTAKAQAETAAKLQSVNENKWRGSKFGKWFGAVTGTIGDITGAIGNILS